jgi:hypothetical protein
MSKGVSVITFIRCFKTTAFFGTPTATEDNLRINSLWRSVYCVSQQVYYPEIPRSAHTVYLCILYGSHNKRTLFSYTELTDWFL